MDEIYKSITEFSGNTFNRYEVSNIGNVRSIDSINEFFTKLTNDFMSVPLRGCVLVQKSTKFGHKQVCLHTTNHKKKWCTVHRLVADAFIRKLTKDDVINHLDNNPANNCVTNLEITTTKGNVHHSILYGNLKRPFNKDDIDLIFNMRNNENKSMRIIAEHMGCSHTTIRKILNGLRYII